MNTPEELRTQRDTARDIAIHLEQENGRLIDMITEAKKHHYVTLQEWSEVTTCGTCRIPWPCPTINELNGGDLA